MVQVLILKNNSGEWTRHSLELLGDATTLSKKRNWKVRGLVLPNDSLAMIESAASAVLPHLSDVSVTFLPGDSRGDDLAAELSGKSQVEWLSDVLSVTSFGDSLEITTSKPYEKLSRTYRTQNIPVLLSLREGVGEIVPTAKPDAVIELTPIEVPAPQTRSLRVLPSDPRTQDIRVARKIIAGGRGAGGVDGMKTLEAFSESLGASLAASRMAVDLGWASYDRQVGQTGKTVLPDLYVACGISGASHHLAGMRDSKHIVAINTDPRAPIHDVAHLSLKADLHKLVPEIETRLRKRLP